MSSCTTYKARDYEAQINRIKSIAILPVEIIHTGKKPDKISIDELQAQDNEERIAFQKSIFNAISVRQSQSNMRIQSPNETNARLEQAQLNIYEIEKYTVAELREALGVDAVVLTSLTKRRYRGDNESMAIDLAQTVLRETLNKSVPNISPRTNEIHLNVSLVNTHDSFTVWANSRRGEVNWNSPVDLIIENMSRGLVQSMPRSRR